MGVCVGDQLESVDLYSSDCVNDSNLREMPIESSFLSDTSINVQSGKRQDLFWLIVAGMVTVVVVVSSVFRKGKRRRR